MNNIIVLPLIVPILAGIVLVFIHRYTYIQRWISLGSIIINIIISLVILNKIQVDGILRLDFGNWLPPYGILFVADSFAMLLVLTASFVSAVCLIYAMFSIGEAREKLFFYPFVQLLVGGVNGSFLTGDLFNLFVSFEVMLLARSEERRVGKECRCRASCEL